MQAAGTGLGRWLAHTCPQVRAQVWTRWSEGQGHDGTLWNGRDRNRGLIQHKGSVLRRRRSAPAAKDLGSHRCRPRSWRITGLPLGGDVPVVSCRLGPPKPDVVGPRLRAGRVVGPTGFEPVGRLDAADPGRSTSLAGERCEGPTRAGWRSSGSAPDGHGATRPGGGGTPTRSLSTRTAARVASPSWAASTRWCRCRSLWRLPISDYGSSHYHTGADGRIHPAGLNSSRLLSWPDQ